MYNGGDCSAGDLHFFFCAAGGAAKDSDPLPGAAASGDDRGIGRRFGEVRVDLVMKESNLNEATAGDWYAAMVQNGGYAKDAAFDAEGFKKTLQLRAEIEAGGNGAAPAAEKYYDLSYYRAALAKIN